MNGHYLKTTKTRMGSDLSMNMGDSSVITIPIENVLEEKHQNETEHHGATYLKVKKTYFVASFQLNTPSN